MEKWCSVKDVAGIMRCSKDTARRRMESMPGVINAGTQGRRQLLVPERNVEDWLRNRQVHPWPEAPEADARVIRIPRSKSGRMARINRRTGKLEAV